MLKRFLVAGSMEIPRRGQKNFQRVRNRYKIIDACVAVKSRCAIEMVCIA
jgi:hypothetical protein